jgi:hypothetical protein
MPPATVLLRADSGTYALAVGRRAAAGCARGDERVPDRWRRETCFACVADVLSTCDVGWVRRGAASLLLLVLRGGVSGPPSGLLLIPGVRAFVAPHASVLGRLPVFAVRLAECRSVITPTKLACGSRRFLEPEQSLPAAGTRC